MLKSLGKISLQTYECQELGSLPLTTEIDDAIKPRKHILHIDLLIIIPKIPPNTSAESKATCSGYLWMDKHALAATERFRAGFVIRLWNASELGSMSNPVQFRSLSKNKELLRYSPSQAPASIKKPDLLPLRKWSIMADWLIWPNLVESRLCLGALVMLFCNNRRGFVIVSFDWVSGKALKSIILSQRIQSIFLPHSGLPMTDHHRNFSMSNKGV